MYTINPIAIRAAKAKKAKKSKKAKKNYSKAPGHFSKLFSQLFSVE